ncbi:MAG: FAD-dependent oxidoreductase, partial [Ilumatobacteraceae bacterium]
MGCDGSDGVGQRAGHDTVVIGAGPAGAAAAVTLARAGRHVLLVAARRPDRTSGVGEG